MTMPTSPPGAGPARPVRTAARDDSALVAVWGVLVAATLLSWWVGHDHGASRADLSASTLITIALAKVYLVGTHFMELRHADPRLLRAFQGYVALVAVALVGIVTLG